MSEHKKSLGNDLFDGLVTEHADSMPDPSEHAIAAEAEGAAEGPGKWQGERDASGTPFDPEIHATDSAGNPSRTKNGYWRKRPGRKSGTGPRSQLNRAEASGATPGADSYRESAEATIDSMMALATMFGGEEFAPRTITDPNTRKVIVDERENGIRVFERYYRHKNMRDIPPGIAVAIFCAGYFGQRFAQNQTVRSRVKNGLVSFGSKIKGMFGRRKETTKAADKKEA